MIPLIRLRAAFDQYPNSGRAGVALALDKSDDVLRKEASGSSQGHKLGFVDAIRALETLQNAGVDVAPVLASIVSHFGYRLAGDGAAAHDVPDLSVLSAEASQEVSELALAVVVANSDGVITQNEMKAAQSKVIEARDAITRLERAVAAKAAADKAAREAA